MGMPIVPPPLTRYVRLASATPAGENTRAETAIECPGPG